MDAAIVCSGPQDCPEGYVCEGQVCLPGDGGILGDQGQQVPDIAVDPTDLDFGSAEAGVAVSRTVTVRNEGTADLTITSVTLDEPGNLAEFSADPLGDIQRVIEPGGSIQVTVTLVSLDDESDNATLLIASNDPDEAMVQVPLTSTLDGQSNLATCVMQADDLFSNCAQNPEVIDYGDLDFDATALAGVSLYNSGEGNMPLVVSDIHVTNETGQGDLFSLRFFRLVADSQAPNGYRQVEATDFPDVPFILGPDDGQGAPEAVIVEVEFHGALDGQDVPAENLVFIQADAQAPQHLIPFSGHIACPPDHYDYDGQPGCEYECSITHAGEEICDGLDNDCNGQTDEGANPGLCLVCDQTGTAVQAADDEDCGVVDCSNWFTKTGQAGPRETDECHAHENMVADRCEGPEDCKDSNSSDCDAMALLPAPTVTCGVCKHVSGCSGTSPGTCENYPQGTNSGLCSECDGNGNEVAAADDNDCGVLDCSGWYQKQGTAGPTSTETCYAHQDITSNRCEDLADCKDPNSSDCDSQPLESSAAETCAVCRYMVGCSGTNAPRCIDYPAGTPTSGTCGVGVCQVSYHCDGSGNDVCNPGSATGPDSDCNGLDDDCDGAADNHYVPYTCGLGVCTSQSTCTNGSESCIPGAPQGADSPDDGFVDRNCDGIDGDESQALFVAPDGNDAWPGTKAQPKRTIQAAIDAAAGPGRDVYISSGTYDESLTLRSNVSLYGGYSRADDWARSDSYHAVIQGGVIAMDCNGKQHIVVDHLEIRAANNTSAGGSSYAVRLVSCSDVTIRKSTLVGNDGGAGTGGQNGSTGADGADGSYGQSGREHSNAPGCANLSIPQPGPAGSGCNGNDGGRGGYPGGGTNNGHPGLAGQGSGGGAGGSGGTCDRDWNGGCGTSGACYNGKNGANGSSGASGNNGLGGVAFNQFSTTSYMPAWGQSGTNGSPGAGGGGGGGGHGGDDGCDSYGSAGAGGGGGGCGGTGGHGGGGGGGSFALWTHACTTVHVASCTLVTGNGGHGGAGGQGGARGVGGSGGLGFHYGITHSQDDAGCGGSGGHGGAGGWGGQGGGGGGGPSIGIVFHSCSSCMGSFNNFTLGSSGGGGMSFGHQGLAGLRQNVYSY